MGENSEAHPRRLRPPTFALPAGAADTHFHVFGPARRYPYQADRAFTPDDALPAAAMEVFRQAGIARAVLIQPSAYGTDNSRHLDAAAELRIPTRVVVAIDTDAPDAHLAALRDRGATGVRRILPQGAGRDLGADLERLASRASELGWHLQLLARPEHLIALENVFAHLPCPLVFDHLGMIDVSAGVPQPAFQALLRLLKRGRSYAKISGCYRVSRQEAPYADLKPFVTSLVEAADDRAIWGSDWPHPAFSGTIPAYADLLDPLAGWIPDEGRRRRVLVSNPAALYGFEPTEKAA